MTPSKADICRNKILERVQQVPMAGYIFEEVEKLLDYLHYYKLRNILKNTDVLIAYLRFLDKQNHKQIKKLFKQYKSEEEAVSGNLSHFVSMPSIEELGEENLLQLFQNKEAQHDIQNIIWSIKGLLLLTANEFCHASSTRISLNKMQWERSDHKKKIKKQKKTE